MTSFADSEKRLIAALGRIDKALQTGAHPQHSAPAGTDSARATGADDAALKALQAENDALRQQLSAAGAETARLAEAVEALSAENARLTEGQGDADAALRAELDALKASRAAEMAALDEIMSELESLIARAPRASDAPFAEDVAPAPGDVVSFDQNEG